MRSLCCGETILTTPDGVDMVNSYDPTGADRAETVRTIDGEVDTTLSATAGRKGELRQPPPLFFFCQPQAQASLKVVLLITNDVRHRMCGHQQTIPARHL